MLNQTRRDHAPGVPAQCRDPRFLAVQDSLLAALRRATRPHHEQVEITLALDGPLELHRYVEVLHGFDAWLSTWEPAMHAALPATLRGWFDERRRGPRLRRDLAALGARSRCEPPPRLAIPLDTESHMMGSLYVLEGSALGGQVIARRLQDHLGLDASNGASYFAGWGANTGAMWREFTGMLARHDQAGADHAAACTAAAATFDSLSQHFARELHAG